MTAPTVRLRWRPPPPVTLPRRPPAPPSDDLATVAPPAAEPPTPRLRRLVPAHPLPHLLLLPHGAHAVRLPRARGPLDLPLQTPPGDLPAARLAELEWQLAWVRGELVDQGGPQPPDAWAYGPGLPSTYTDG